MWLCLQTSAVWIPVQYVRVEEGCPTANHHLTTSGVDTRVSVWGEYTKSTTFKSRDAPTRAGGRESRVNARSFSSLPPLGLANMSCVHPVMMEVASAPGEEGPKMSCEMQSDTMLRCCLVILQSSYVTMRNVAA